jgi:2,4-dienoyl-CoA reductase (NADPH2)
LVYIKTKKPKRIAVVGGGVAGMSAATVAASRGHAVTLFEASNDVGGQFNLAKVVPGKKNSTKPFVTLRCKSSKQVSICV